MSNESEADRREGRLSDRDLALFAGQVAGLATAGLPLPSGLRALGDESPDGALRRIFHDVARRLEAGESLDRAIDAQGGRVPGHLKGLLLAGLRSGKLGEVLGRYVDASRGSAEVRRKLWLGLMYPLMLLTAAFVILTFICGAIVPNFEKIFRDFGLSIPAPTMVVLEASRIILAIPWWLPLAAAGMATALLLARLVLRVGVVGRWLIGPIPLPGTLGHWTALAEYSRLLGLLIEGEMPLPIALRLAGEGVRDSRLTVAAQQAAHDVEAGHTLGEALTLRTRFPAGYGHLVAWGEGNRSLPQALDVLGSLYEARAQAHASLVGAVVGVLVMVLVLWGISVVIIALMMPMYQLMSALSGGS